MVFGITNGELLEFLVILIGSIVVSKIIMFVLQKYIRAITQKTKTDVDDIILNIITWPINVFIIFLGFYLSLNSLSILDVYDKWISGAFFVFTVLIVSSLLARLSSVFTARWLRVQKKFEKMPKLVDKIVSITVYLIAVLMILSHFEIEITPLLATLGLGGLAIGLALQGTLSNLFAGLHIISDRPINVGDFIEIEDGKVSGYVEDIGWRSTRIRTLPNTIVIVPNSKLADSVIVNDTLPQPEMAALVQVGVAYSSDLEEVEKITVDVARKIQKTVNGAIENFEPFIRYHTFADSNINFTVILRVKTFVDKYLVTHEFIKALKKRYDKEGIEISWPVRKVYYGDKSGR